MSRTPQYRVKSEESKVLPGAHIVCRDPFKLERRREAREEATGTVSASYSNEHDRVGITHLELLDRSPRGLRVRTRTPIEPGMRVTICPEGSTIPWLAARAVRSERRGNEWIVGLQLQGLAAAA